MKIFILRLGHRIFRDQRLTTHVFLTARALGASRGFYTGQKDQEMEESVRKAATTWGGSFGIEYLENEKMFLKKFKRTGKVIHLTVYGLPFQGEIKKIKKSKNLLVIVGGEKVPPEIYEQADWNLAVGSQPHSEVAALGIFLYELQNRTFKKSFKKPFLRVIPQEKGKKVMKA